MKWKTKLYIASLLASFCFTQTASANEPVSAENQSAESFIVLDKSKLGVVLYDKTADFSKYSKVMLFPLRSDQMRISDLADEKFKLSWREIDPERMKRITGTFDKLALKTFRSSKQFSLAEEPSADTLALQFRMLEFSPDAIQDPDKKGTVGQTFNLAGIGNLQLQILLVDSSTKQVVAILDDIVNISAGRTATEDNRMSRNRAWKRSFKIVLKDLHSDILKL